MRLSLVAHSVERKVTISLGPSLGSPHVTKSIVAVVSPTARGHLLRLTDKVRRKLLQLGALLLLLVCLCGPIAEAFDYWDHTLQTGNDIEYSLVVLALVAGAAFGLAHAAANAAFTVSSTSYTLPPFVAFLSGSPASPACSDYSPPQPLRI